MADVEVVIKIPEVLYWAIKQNVSTDSVYDAVKNGILLPKIHGRIIDESEITSFSFERHVREICGVYQEFCNIHSTSAPTIVESNKEDDCNV